MAYFCPDKVVKLRRIRDGAGFCGMKKGVLMMILLVDRMDELIPLTEVDDRLRTFVRGGEDE